MSHICCVCHEKIRPDTAGAGVSHGYCRYDMLSALKDIGLISPVETLELMSLDCKGNMTIDEAPHPMESAVCCRRPDCGRTILVRKLREHEHAHAVQDKACDDLGKQERPII